MRFVFAASAGLVLAGTAFAQFVGTSARADGKTATITIQVAPPGARNFGAVTGAPCSGTPTSQSVQTLADGTHITRPAAAREKTFRDSGGRVRTERPLFGRRGDPTSLSPVALIEVQDPVAGYAYVIDSANHVAHRVAIQARQRPVRAEIGPPAGTRTLPDGSVAVTESLGTKTMSGVTVNGTRTVTTHPAGSRLGNDKPVTTTDEVWWSPQLGMMVSSQSTGVDGTVQTRSIPDLSTAEPDPALFQVPAGYSIVDETGSFTMTMALRQN